MDGELTVEQRLERVEKMLERWTEFAERLDRRFNGPVSPGYHNNAFDDLPTGQESPPLPTSRD